MYSFNPQFAKDTNARHCYLAKKQNSQIAVLLIHTKPEQLLFRAMLTGPQAQREPNWEDFAQDRNSHCNGPDIYYKVHMLQSITQLVLSI